MSRTITLHLVGCLFFILFFTTSVKAQNEAKAFNVDSTLYEYYQRCQECLLQPIVLSMADSLFNMATARKDQRMQAVAISTKLDYHYFQANNEDSVIYYTDRVKEFAKATNQPKYYYFSWASRLILYYLKMGKANIALYEAQKMLAEAQKEDNKIGLLNCYKVMSQIYTVKEYNAMAFEWRLKEIELTEKHKLENYNISQTYTQIANYYINQQKQKEAFEALKNSVETSNSSPQKISAQLEYVNYYSQFGDFKTAEKTLNELKVVFEQDKRQESNLKRLYSAECLFYQRTKQYQKALDAAEKQEMEEKRFNESALNSKHYRIRGEIYKEMGNLPMAIEYLQKSIAAEDTLKMANEQIASSEFATLLDVERLNADKKELILQAQKKELHNLTTLIISLIVLLSILFLFLYRESRLNRKLKISEGELKSRNEELTLSREELSIAKDIAEANSRMKTTFIQSMSHEIRTPLNSIVGFSQILNEHYSKEYPECTEYVNIIETNSNDLLRLVTDVLILSELDQHIKLPMDIPTDINMLCELAFEIAKGSKMEDVEVFFKPERESLEILSNPERIAQVLKNLVHNATKFTTQGSITIAYSVLEAKKRVELSVTDTGIGIAIDKQEEVFERFAKLDAFTQGTGLGLPIGRSIAEKLDGSLRIDHSYTNGCRMVLSLPLIYAQ